VAAGRSAGIVQAFSPPTLAMQKAAVGHIGRVREMQTAGMLANMVSVSRFKKRQMLGIFGRPFAAAAVEKRYKLRATDPGVTIRRLSGRTGGAFLLRVAFGDRRQLR
jgi:hypothetical protein